MPIYAYRCDACGHAKDVLQKLSDPVLSTCPSCGQASFRKQVTAAGFQLKGSGWYVTDFRGGASNGAAKPEGDGAPKTDGTTGTEATPAPAATPAAASASDSASDSAPAAGCGTSCACH